MYHQDTEIHDRLLYTGQCGERDYLFQTATVEVHVFAMQPQLRTFLAGIEQYSRRSRSLRYDCGYRSSLDAPTQLQDKEQVEHDIQYDRDGQKPERSYRISHRTQQRRIEIIDECENNAAKDYPQVAAHHAVDVLRYLQQAENRV